MHYYSHNIKEFRAGCHNLESRLERWIYRDMIEAYYDREKPFPDDLTAICAMLGLRREAEKEIVSGLLLLKFVLTERGWENERCEIELAAYRKNVGQASAAGIASAAAKKAAKEAKLTLKDQQNSNIRSTTVEHPLNDRSMEINNQATNQEPLKQEPLKPKVKNTVPPSGETDVVFAYWQQVMNHPQAKLDAKRERAIKARLKDGYTVEQICKAIDGCKVSPYHSGQNDNRTVYDSLELICRDGARIDAFIGHAERGPIKQVGPPQNEKFHFGAIDRSGDQAAMDLSMKRNNIVVEDGDIPF